MTRVLVGIPTLNGPDRLRRCLASIAAYPPADERLHLTVLVCDDGSEPEALKLNKDVIHTASEQIPGLEMLINEKRLGIATSWNRLVRHTCTDVVILLNDDIEVVEHWADVLVYSVMENERAGMVGLNSYVGTTAAQAPPPGPRIDFHESKLMGGGSSLLTSSGAAFAFRRTAYDMVGGFDERYFCFYEEVDFGVMMLGYGLRHFIASYPIVFHMGGATNADPRNLIASERMSESRRLFRQKWGGSPRELRERQPALSRFPLREWNTQLVRLSE